VPSRVLASAPSTNALLRIHDATLSNTAPSITQVDYGGGGSAATSSTLSHVSGSVTSGSNTNSIYSGKSSDFALSPRSGSGAEDISARGVRSMDGDGGMLTLGGDLSYTDADHLYPPSLTDASSDSNSVVKKSSTTSGAFKNTTLYALQALYPDDTRKKETIIFFPASVSKSEQEIQAFIHRRYPDREVKKIEKHDVTFKFSQKVIKYSSVKNVVVRSGVKYHHTGKKYPKRAKSEWVVKWGLNQTQKCYSNLTKYQVFNHFPGSWALGRKDSLYRHLDAMRRQHGYNEFPFFPKTWILPGQKKELKSIMEEETKGKKSNSKTNMWIIKPQNSCCGRGISIVRSYDQVKKKLKNSTAGWIVQDYISNPLLLRGCKFDLRLYVCVTSYDPLRIYLFHDGLCRISTRKYSLTKDSRFVHLTNFSVHKKSKSFIKNSDADADGEGHKWSLPALRRFLKERGIDDTKMWEDTNALIIKTILSVESKVNQLTKKSLSTKENILFELLGFDVLIDENLNPHILEVNCGPSLSASSPLDLKIKSNLLADIYTLIGVQPVSRKTLHKEKLTLRSDHRLEAMQSVSKNDESQPFKRTLPELMRLDKLDFLTEEDLHVVTETEEENSRRGQFERIFPTKHTWKRYHHLFPSVRYKNLLVHLFLSNSSSKKRALLARKKYLPPSTRPAFVPTASYRLQTSGAEKMDPELRKAQKKYKKVRSRYRSQRKKSVAKKSHNNEGVWAMDKSSIVQFDRDDNGTVMHDEDRHMSSQNLRKRSQSAPSRRRESISQSQFTISELKFPAYLPKRAYASPRSSVSSTVMSPRH